MKNDGKAEVLESEGKDERTWSLGSERTHPEKRIDDGELTRDIEKARHKKADRQLAKSRIPPVDDPGNGEYYGKENRRHEKDVLGPKPVKRESGPFAWKKRQKNTPGTTQDAPEICENPENTCYPHNRQEVV